MFIELGESKLSCIYCSKLLRAIQTAYEIAKILSLPIVLSEGFARTAQAVEQMNGQFQYLTIDELTQYCPGVEFIDGDINTNNTNNTNNSDIADISNIHTIPNTGTHWYNPLRHVGQQETSIVVAHRETIRNIAFIRQRIPYCGYATFQFPKIATINNRNNRNNRNEGGGDSDSEGGSVMEWDGDSEGVRGNNNNGMVMAEFLTLRHPNGAVVITTL